MHTWMANDKETRYACFRQITTLQLFGEKRTDIVYCNILCATNKIARILLKTLRLRAANTICIMQRGEFWCRWAPLHMRQRVAWLGLFVDAPRSLSLAWMTYTFLFMRPRNNSHYHKSNNIFIFTNAVSFAINWRGMLFGVAAMQTFNENVKFVTDFCHKFYWNTFLFDVICFQTRGNVIRFWVTEADLPSVCSLVISRPWLLCSLCHVNMTDFEGFIRAKWQANNINDDMCHRVSDILVH